ncbi:pyridoxamine 5'-phosphate oxidase family protein [Geovibrio sp. ADMFC3]|jgi:nitroimidazol reductase NimA-like FMN-containing flavoprotein (pyridoxamine 5'-phosphate oxidase superfamily)
MKDEKLSQGVTRRKFGKILAGAGVIAAAGAVSPSTLFAAQEKKREFRPLRNTAEAMNERDTIAALHDGRFGILSTVNKEGFPVGTPISYVFKDGNIYIHTSKVPGEKMINFTENPDVCFTIVNYAIPSTYKNTLGTLFKSVMVFGRVSLVEDPDEKKAVMTAISTKYLPTFTEDIEGYYKKLNKAMNAYCIKIDHMTGKERGEKHY